MSDSACSLLDDADEHVVEEVVHDLPTVEEVVHDLPTTVFSCLLAWILHMQEEITVIKQTHTSGYSACTKYWQYFIFFIIIDSFLQNKPSVLKLIFRQHDCMVTLAC